MTQSRQQRLTSNVALALALTSLLSSLVHMGAVRHERCAEHGELVELAGHAERSLEPAHEGAMDVAALLTARVSSEGEHEHCPLASMSALPAAEVGCESELAVLAPRAAFATRVALVVAKDILGFAPKTSPPALA